MPHINIRHGEQIDCDELFRVHRTSILDLGLSAYTKDECQSWASGLTPQGYWIAMTSGGETYLLAEVDGEVSGFCSFRDDEIMGLYVDPSASCHGIGSLLLQKAECNVIAAGRSPIRVTAALSAVGFYQRHDYSIHERRKWKTRGGLEIEVCEMAKDLMRTKTES